jgi:hypothetical protein
MIRVRSLLVLAALDVTATSDSRFVLQRVDNRADKRYGIATLEQWDRLKSIYKDQKIVEGTVPAADFYSSALVVQINRFDREAVIRQAKEYKF